MHNPMNSPGEEVNFFKLPRRDSNLDLWVEFAATDQNQNYTGQNERSPLFCLFKHRQFVLPSCCMTLWCAATGKFNSLADK